ncbi:MAG: basic rane protein [Kosmotogales bacterium]|nr:basic rane protein [Kosmotogales bacterium]
MTKGKVLVFLVVILLSVFSFAKLNVAIVAGDAIGDRGFTDMAYEGIQAAAQDFDVEYKIFECHVDPSKYFDALKAAASRYDLIFVDPGYYFDKELKEVSELYPDKTFVYIDGGSDLPNVVSVPFKQNEGAFLAGCLAALLTDKTALEFINDEYVVGFVGGADMPVIRDYEAGFKQGVKYVDPEMEIVSKFAGTHYDPAKGKETAYSVFNEGADVIFQAAGPTGLGVLEAAKDYDFYAIGVDTDQAYLQPGSIVSSMLKRVDVAVYDITKMAIDGTLEKGATYIYGVANDGISLAYNDDMQSIVPYATYVAVQDIQEKIKDGEIVVESYIE